MKSSQIRRNRTRDIWERLGFITPDKIRVRNHPFSRPLTAFNPGAILHRGKIIILPRLIFRYYLYVSSIGLTVIDPSDLLGGETFQRGLEVDLAIWPETVFDIYGCEDPRIHEVDGKIVVVYVGRSREYYPRFYKLRRGQQTYPILAYMGGNLEIEKKLVFGLDERFVNGFVGDRDAVILHDGPQRIFLLHRPQIENFPLTACYSKIPHIDELLRNGLRKFVLREPKPLISPERFEYRVGWATPPIKLSEGWLALLHSEGIDCVYRVFAALLDIRGDEVVIKAVTPDYIMEPKTSFERFGDRPQVVFPCGAILLDDEILLSYGASDTFISFARTRLEELLSELKMVEG